MTDKYRDVKHSLVAISEEIYDHAYDFYSLPSEWDEAGVSFTSDPSGIDPKSSAGRLTVITSAAPQLAWLFGRVRDAFASLGGLERDHYQRLAVVAGDYELTSNREYKVNGILREVMNEAFVILREREKEAFGVSRSQPATGLQSGAIPQATNRWQEGLVR